MRHRLAQEIRFLAGRGLGVGLIQTVRPPPGTAIAAEVQACLRGELARVFPGGAARHLILHCPSSAPAELPGLHWRDLERIDLVCHGQDDLKAASRPEWRTADAQIRVVRRSLRRPAGGAPDLDCWLPPVTGQAGLSRVQLRPAIGWWGACVADGLEGYDHVRVDRLSLPLERIVAGLDVLAVRDDDIEPPDTLVAAMLAAGRAVVVDPGLRRHYGTGPAHVTDTGHAAAVRRALRRRGGRSQFLERCRAAPVTRIAPRAAAPRPPQPCPRPRPILCLSSNGVGLGHLTRLLAVARRLAPAEIVFVTQAQATGIVGSFGYPVEYLPSPAATGGSFGHWDDWFAAQLSELMDRHDPALVIYDGNHLTDGLLGAVAGRGDCRLAWIRRGMWGRSISAYIENSRWCDLIIEPGELAAERDHSVTAGRRGEVLVVDPIRLLDAQDLLSRADAMDRLGLNPARPAVLVQLGAGATRDIVSLLDRVIGMLSAVPGLQIAVTEWANGAAPLALWPEVTVLKGFPVAQYLRAFDFCISAAGYNAFHELVALEVPTVFVANRHPSMDDQYARAKFAQDNGAAFEISEAELDDLAEMLPLLMDDRARRFLSERCRLLARPNGAQKAASALRELAALPATTLRAAE